MNRKAVRHRNIPIFIPHLGCPNLCVFCNQRSISGKQSFDVKSVKAEIEAALDTIPADCEVEIAYFGGSFTGIDRESFARRTAMALASIVRISAWSCCFLSIRVGKYLRYILSASFCTFNSFLVNLIFAKTAIPLTLQARRHRQYPI